MYALTVTPLIITISQMYLRLGLQMMLLLLDTSPVVEEELLSLGQLYEYSPHASKL